MTRQRRTEQRLMLVAGMPGVPPIGARYRHAAGSRRELLTSTALGGYRRAVGAAVLGVTMVGGGAAHALPQDGQVVAGTASISQPSSSSVVVSQSTEKPVINWKSFDVGTTESVQFVQPSSSSWTLNRVTAGTDPSLILGSLSANGGVMVINPNGVLFGPNSKVDVSGLVASTADIANHDFMAGNFNFGIAGSSGGAIVNQGTINIANQGLAAFVAPSVRNDGMIVARLGKVSLASANTYTLDLYGDQLVNVAIDGQVVEAITGLKGEAVSSAVTNTGQIIADGGRVALTADVARGVVDNAINMSGVVRARSVDVVNGEIVLDGGEAGTVEVSGTLDVSGSSKGQTGGRAIVTGEKVKVASTAKIDASGYSGGGKVLIGGDYLGGSSASQAAAVGVTLEDVANRTSQSTEIAAGAVVTADATTAGNGGKLIVWSDGTTTMNGTLSARGGAVSGDGGFIETSGTVLSVGMTPDASAAYGVNGAWLLDPSDIAITSSTSGVETNESNDGLQIVSISESSKISPDIIEAALNSGTNVTIQTSSSGDEWGHITFWDEVNKTSGGDATLTLIADGYVYPWINASVGKLDVVIEAMSVSDPNHRIKTTNGGSITVNASYSGNITNWDTCSSTACGDITINAVRADVSDSHANNIIINASGDNSSVDVGGATAEGNFTVITNGILSADTGIQVDGDVYLQAYYIYGSGGWTTKPFEIRGDTKNLTVSIVPENSDWGYSPSAYISEGDGTIISNINLVATGSASFSIALNGGDGIYVRRGTDLVNIYGSYYIYGYNNNRNVSLSVEGAAVTIGADAVNLGSGVFTLNVGSSGSVTGLENVIASSGTTTSNPYANSTADELFEALKSGVLTTSSTNWTGLMVNGQLTSAQTDAVTMLTAYNTYKNATADQLFEAIKSGALVPRSDNLAWRALYVNGQATSTQTAAYTLWTTYLATTTNPYASATAEQLFEALKSGTLKASLNDANWAALYVNNQLTQAQTDALTMMTAYLAYYNATAETLFVAIKNGQLTPSSTDLEWKALYVNGSATTAQISAYTMWTSYSTYSNASAQTLFDAIKSGALTPSSTNVAWTILYVNGSATSAQSDAYTMWTAYQTWGTATASQLFEAIKNGTLTVGTLAWTALYVNGSASTTQTAAWSLWETYLASLNTDPGTGTDTGTDTTSPGTSTGTDTGSTSTAGTTTTPTTTTTTTVPTTTTTTPQVAEATTQASTYVPETQKSDFTWMDTASMTLDSLTNLASAVNDSIEKKVDAALSGSPEWIQTAVVSMISEGLSSTTKVYSVISNLVSADTINTMAEDYEITGNSKVLGYVMAAIEEATVMVGTAAGAALGGGGTVVGAGLTAGAIDGGKSLTGVDDIEKMADYISQNQQYQAILEERLVTSLTSKINSGAESVEFLDHFSESIQVAVKQELGIAYGGGGGSW